MQNEPFFTRDGAIYQPTPASRGPWDPKSLHGRVIIGLLGHVLEREHGDPDFIPARLTVDMYRLPDHSPVEVKTNVVRAGGRIKVIDAEFVSGGVSAGRATCQFLRRTENAPGNVWSPPDWDAPAPDAVAPPSDGRAGMGGMWEARPIKGGFGHFGQKQTWMREVREIVGGEALTPFTRIAVASDFTSPFAHAGTEGLGYINSDVTLYLHRLPAGEWVGFESVDHHADAGVAVGGCRLYDEQGSIGAAYCAALAQRRSAR
ncbi:MAG: thioesterase family protein [Caulobacteraceae bacterium]|nr:thioesterase family protein [Caulobacteraceae bacterium]